MFTPIDLLLMKSLPPLYITLSKITIFEGKNGPLEIISPVKVSPGSLLSSCWSTLSYLSSQSTRHRGDARFMLQLGGMRGT